MNILIIGSGPQALFLLRVLARVGHAVTILALDKKVAGFSKYGTKIICNDLCQFTSHLENLSQTVDRVFLCGGKELQFIIDKAPHLFEIADVYPKPFGAIKIFSDKLETYRYMEMFGLKSPRTHSISELKLLLTLPNPLIAKWNQEAPPSLVLNFKTKVFNCLDELINFIDKIEADALQYLVFQDFIPGNDFNNISLQVAFNNKSLSGHLLVRKLRVSRNGYTSYIEELELDENFKNKVFEPVIKAFLEQGYSGLAEIEFKLCSATGVYYLIEVNPRPCGLVSAMGGKYEEFGRYLEGGDLSELKLRGNVRWSSILRDVQTCLLGYKEHSSLYQVIKDLNSIRRANSFDIFDIFDIKPFFSQLVS